MFATSIHSSSMEAEKYCCTSDSTSKASRWQWKSNEDGSGSGPWRVLQLFFQSCKSFAQPTLFFPSSKLLDQTSLVLFYLVRKYSDSTIGATSKSTKKLYGRCIGISLILSPSVYVSKFPPRRNLCSAPKKIELSFFACRLLSKTLTKSFLSFILWVTIE